LEEEIEIIDPNDVDSLFKSKSEPPPSSNRTV